MPETRGGFGGAGEGPTKGELEGGAKRAPSKYSASRERLWAINSDALYNLTGTSERENQRMVKNLDLIPERVDNQCRHR